MALLRRFTILFCASLCLVYGKAAVAVEEIEDFSSIVNIRQDGIVMVSENLKYNFGGVQRNEIFRDFQNRYEINGKAYWIRIKDAAAKDDKGIEYKTKISNKNGNTRLTIYSEGKPFSGKKIFYVTYRIENAIKDNSGHSEFKWNVNGGGWRINTVKAKIVLLLPEKSTPSNLSGECLYGLLDKNIRCSPKITTDNNGVIAEYSTPSNLYSGEDFNISLAFPSDLMIKLTTWMKFKMFASDNWAACTPLLSLLIGLLWRKKKIVKKVGSFRNNPPEDLALLEMAYLKNGSINRYDVATEIFHLANKGYLTIELTKNNEGVGDYWIIKRRQYGQMANDFDMSILNSLFSERESVLLSIWQNELIEIMPEIINGVKNSLIAKDHLYKNPGIRRIYAGLTAVILSVIGMAGSYLFNLPFVFEVSLILSGLVIFLIGLSIPPKTKNQLQAEIEITGYINYLLSSQISENISSTNVVNKNPTLFENSLPEALALGVGKQWANQFANTVVNRPSWFGDPFWPDTINSFNVYNDVETFAKVLNGDLILSKIV